MINPGLALHRATHGIAAPAKIQAVTNGALVVISLDAIAARTTKQL
jgi:hypothetical protein